MSRFLSFPGFLEFAILPVLIVLYQLPDRPLALAVTVAVIRVLLPLLICRRYVYLSNRDMTYNLIFFVVALVYLMFSSHGWRAAVMAYFGAGGLTAIVFIFCAELMSRIRSYKR